jgi:NAD(P)-dependent dehydrogenase (short-subunit alcohol dehydrogenase family)
MDVRSLKGKRVLVTGAASGIGQATALACARRGADLVLCDINEPGLAEVSAAAEALGCSVFARRVDVSVRHEMHEFAESVYREVGVLDILINNAGVGLGANFLDTPLEDWDWIIGINLLGVVHGCFFFIPPMVARGAGGHVVNVSSAAGYVATPPLTAYSATKFAVLGLSEALRQELAPHRIGVTAVCPGIINTPITRSARLRGAAADERARERMVRFYQQRNYPPERVAENILKAIQRNRGVAPISPEAWLFYYLKRFAPGFLHRLNQWLAKRAGAGSAEAAAR